MARTYNIASITPSAGLGNLGRIELDLAAANQTASFQGKFYRNSTPVSQPFYAGLPVMLPAPAPYDYVLIKATTFEIINNPSYNGVYTVYTPTSGADLSMNPSAEFVASKTLIRVFDTVSAPTIPAHATNTGQVTNISTYLFTLPGEATVLIPPGVTITNRPLELIGRNSTPWGESFNQNQIDLVTHFASSSAPSLPYYGQIWYDTAASELKLCTNVVGPVWVTIAAATSGANITVRIPFVPVANTPVAVAHGMNLTAPFLPMVQIFVNDGGTWKMILPQDLVFTSANVITVTTTLSYIAAYALLRA